MLAASCANDDFSGDNNAALPTGDGSIAFNMNMPATSRADGTTTDAGKLGNMFIVWGEKGETSGAEATDGNVVFKNYKVEYTSNSANTTTSNTNNWEYVGLTPYAEAKVKPSILTSATDNTKQTIKYWDDQASSYTFTAISALDSDINPTGDNATPTVVIEKNTGSSENGKTVYDKGYTVTLKSGAKTDNIFFSDRNYIAKPTDGYTHAAVQMTFRNFMSKIRFGIYETVPGYKVVITGLKYTTAAAQGETSATEVTHTNGSTTEGGKIFGITGDFVVTGDGTKYIVTYENSQSGNKNKAKVEISGTANKATYMTTEGTTWLSTSPSDPVGKTANAPTWDKKNNSNGGDYTTILPNPGNKTNLKLQISYKLISEDTGEVIEFKNGNDEIFRTVEVPAQYCTWKSNYAYTYLFKITDKSAELYPITFDAVVVSDQVGNQETITTVSEPSITTFATRTTDGKTTVVTSENEYKGGDVIYAYAQDGTSTAAMSSSNMKLYKVTLGTGVTSEEVTEAAVDHALKNSSVDNKKLNVTEITSSGTESDRPSYDAIPGEDGVSRTITGMKWTATAGTYYAVEYIKTTTTQGSTDTTTAKYYKIVKVASGD